MARRRKLQRTTAQRKALLRNQVTNLLYHGKIVTTAAKAEEVQRIAEKLITIAKKEKDNFETVTITAKVPRKDKDGKRVKQIVDRETGAVLHESHRDENGKLYREEKGKTVTVYDEVQKEIKKDLPSRMVARRKILSVLYPVTQVPVDEQGRIVAAGRKRNTKKVDMAAKLFDEVAPKYAERNGGYTRIVKLGQRKGDAALMVLIELI